MKAVTIDAVDTHLSQQVATDLARLHALDAAPALQKTWRIDNPYSTVWCLLYVHSAWSGRVYVKQAKRSGVDHSALRDRLKVEYEMLLHLKTTSLSSATAAAATVQPLALYLDVPALATLAAEGPTLRRLYARNARRWSSRRAGAGLLQRAELAGRWLAEFQDLTYKGTGPFQADELLGYLKVRLERLHRARPHEWDSKRLAALMDAARQRADAVSGAVVLCGRHNDFASHNLIASPGGRLRILDLQAFDEGPSAFDACNFWLEMEWLKLDLSYSATLLAEMQGAFLRGYGRIEPGQPEFELARLRYTLNRLLNEIGSPRRLRSLSLRWHLTVAGTNNWLRRFAASSIDQTPGPGS